MQADTPGPNFLPSEICRLVLGFLKEENYMSTYKCFLKECVHLTEYGSLLRKGVEYPTTIMGLSLLNILDEYATLKLQFHGAERQVSPRSRLQVVRPAVHHELTSPLRTVTIPHSHSHPANHYGTGKQNQSSRTKALMKQMRGLPPRDSPLISSRARSRIRASLNNSQSSDSSLVDYVSQESSPCGHCDNIQESEDDSDDVDVVSQNGPASSTPAVSSRVIGIGVHLPNKSAVVFNWGDTPTTSVELRNSEDVCGATALRSCRSGALPSTSSQVSPNPWVIDDSSHPGRTRSDGGRTRLPCSSRQPTSNSQTAGVATVSQEVCPTRAASLMSRGVQGPEPKDCDLAWSTSPARTLVSTCGQTSDRGSRAATSAAATAASTASHPTSPSAHAALPSDEEGSFLSHTLEVDMSDRPEISPSMQAASKRRKNPPKRRSDANVSTDSTGGGVNEHNPLDKIINSSRFVKTLVDNINRSLYDCSEHQKAPAVSEKSTGPAVAGSESRSQPGPSTSGISLASEDSCLEEFLNRDHQNMSEDAVNKIISMTRNDPIFDELFQIFNADREEYIQREFGRGNASQLSQDAESSGVHQSLHTPPPGSPGPPAIPTTLVSASISHSQPIGLSFMPVCIDINSNSGFPGVVDLQGQGTSASLSESQTLPRIIRQASPKTATNCANIQLGEVPGKAPESPHLSPERSSQTPQPSHAEKTVSPRENLAADLAKVAEMAVCVTRSPPKDQAVLESVGQETVPEEEQFEGQSQVSESASQEMAPEEEGVQGQSQVSGSVGQETVYGEERFQGQTQVSESVRQETAPEGERHQSKAQQVAETEVVPGEPRFQGRSQVSESVRQETAPEGERPRSKDPKVSETETVPGEQRFHGEDQVSEAENETVSREGRVAGQASGQSGEVCMEREVVCATSTVCADLDNAEKQLTRKQSSDSLDAISANSGSAITLTVQKSPCSNPADSASAENAAGQTLVVRIEHNYCNAEGVQSVRTEPWEDSTQSPSLSSFPDTPQSHDAVPISPQRSRWGKLAAAHPSEDAGSQVVFDGTRAGAVVIRDETVRAYRSAVANCGDSCHSVGEELGHNAPDLEQSVSGDSQDYRILDLTPPAAGSRLSSARASPSPERSQSSPETELQPCPEKMPNVSPERPQPSHKESELAPAASSHQSPSQSQPSPVQSHPPISQQHLAESHSPAESTLSRAVSIPTQERLPPSSGRVCSSVASPRRSPRAQRLQESAGVSPRSQARSRSPARSLELSTKPQSSPGKHQLPLPARSSPSAENSSPLQLQSSRSHAAAAKSLPRSFSSPARSRTSPANHLSPSSQPACSPTRLQRFTGHGKSPVKSRPPSQHPGGASGTSREAVTFMRLVQQIAAQHSVRSPVQSTALTSVARDRDMSVGVVEDVRELSQISVSAEDSPRNHQSHHSDPMHSGPSRRGDGVHFAERDGRVVSDPDTALMKLNERTPPHSGSSACAVSDTALAPHTPHRSEAKTPQCSHPRTPQRSRPCAQCLYPRTPPHAVRGTLWHSPDKSPVFPRSGSSLVLFYSPRRARLLNEPIPDEVLEEISLHSESCLSNYSDGQSTSRPGSACGNLQSLERIEEDLHSGLDKSPSTLQHRHESHQSSSQHSVHSFQAVSDGGASVVSRRLVELSHHSSAHSDSASPSSHAGQDVVAVAAPGELGVLARHSVSREELFSSSQNQRDRCSVASVVPGRLEEPSCHSNAHGSAEASSHGQRDAEAFAPSGRSELSRDANSCQSAWSSRQTTSSSGMKNFRMVGRVEASGNPSSSIAQQQQQQPHGLISVGDMMPTVDDLPRSRHSASIFSTRLALQSADQCLEGSAGIGGDSVSGDVSAPTRPVFDGEREMSTSDIFISSGINEDTCKTNISMPILPAAVHQFLASQMAMGELQLPTDLTIDSTLHRTPTSSPQKALPKTCTPRTSPRKHSPLKGLSTHIGRFAALSRRKESSPAKVDPKRNLNPGVREGPKRRQLAENGASPETKSKTEVRKTCSRRSRPFAAISQRKPPSRKSRRIAAIVSKNGCSHQESHATHLKEPQSSSATSCKQQVSPKKSPQKMVAKKTVKTSVASSTKGRKDSSGNDDIEIYSCSTSSDSNSDASSDVPLSEIAKKIRCRNARTASNSRAKPLEELQQAKNSKEQKGPSPGTVTEESRVCTGPEGLSKDARSLQKPTPPSAAQREGQIAEKPISTSQKPDTPPLSRGQPLGRKDLTRLKPVPAPSLGKRPPVGRKNIRLIESHMPRSPMGSDTDVSDELTESDAEKSDKSDGNSRSKSGKDPGGSRPELPSAGKKPPAGTPSDWPGSSREGNADSANVLSDKNCSGLGRPKESSRGSSSTDVEVDVCALSDDGGDVEASTEKGQPTSQSFRKRLAIIAAKKAAKAKRLQRTIAGSSKTQELSPSKGKGSMPAKSPSRSAKKLSPKSHCPLSKTQSPWGKTKHTENSTNMSVSAVRDCEMTEHSSETSQMPRLDAGSTVTEKRTPLANGHSMEGHKTPSPTMRNSSSSLHPGTETCSSSPKADHRSGASLTERLTVSAARSHETVKPITEPSSAPGPANAGDTIQEHGIEAARPATDRRTPSPATKRQNLKSLRLSTKALSPASSRTSPRDKAKLPLSSSQSHSPSRKDCSPRSKAKSPVSSAQTHCVPSATTQQSSAEAAGPPGIGGQAVAGTGWGQQNQTFRFMPVSQPEVVGIQKQGPYRRIKPIMLSKTISSYFASERGGRSGAGQNMFDIGPVPSPSCSVFSAVSPAAWQSELSSGTQTAPPGVLSPPVPPPSSQSQSSLPAAFSRGGFLDSTGSPATSRTLGSMSSLDSSVPVTSPPGGFHAPAPSAASTAVAGGSAPKVVSGSGARSKPSSAEAASPESSSGKADPKPFAGTRSRTRKSSVGGAAPESLGESCVTETAGKHQTAAAHAGEALSDAGCAAGAGGRKPRGRQSAGKTRGSRQPRAATKAAKRQRWSRLPNTASPSSACAATPSPGGKKPGQDQAAEESTEAAADAQKAADRLETEAAVRALVGLSAPDGHQHDQAVPFDCGPREKACSERSRDMDEMIVGQERLTDDETHDCPERVSCSTGRNEGLGREGSAEDQTSHVDEVDCLPETASCQLPEVTQQLTNTAAAAGKSAGAEPELPVPEQPSAAAGLPQASRKRKIRSSPRKTADKRARREPSPAARQDRSRDGVSASLKSPTRKKEGGSTARGSITINEDSTQGRDWCLSMPFLGDISMSPSQPRGLQEAQPPPESFSVVHIEESASGPAGTSSLVSGRSIINRFSSLLDKLESDRRGNPDDNGMVVGTPATMLRSVQTNHLHCAPTESPNPTVEESACPDQTVQEGSAEPGWLPQGVPLVSWGPDPPVQNMQVVLLSQASPQPLGFVFSPPPPQQGHLQLIEDLNKKKGANSRKARQRGQPAEPSNPQGPKETRKRGRRRRKGPSTLHVIPQELVMGSSRCRTLLPKSLLPEACGGGNNMFVVVDSHAPSTSDANTAGLDINPLDAAVQRIFPEFAARGLADNQSGGVTAGQDAGGAATSPHPSTPVRQASSAVSKAQPSRRKSGQRKGRIETATAGMQVEGAKRKRSRKTEASFAADTLPELASPQPLIIDDIILLSGAETPPSTTRAGRKCPRQRGHGMGEKQEETQAGRNAESPCGKPRGPSRQNLTCGSAMQLSAMPASSDSEHAQTSVCGTFSPPQQPSATSAQELFRLMMNPSVPHAVPVAEGDYDVNLSDHDTLTALVPASMLPPLPSSPSDAGSLITTLNHPGSGFRSPASRFDATPELTAFQAPATGHSGQHRKSPLASTSAAGEDAASASSAAGQRDGPGSSALADFPQPAPAKRTARGLASGKQHPGGLGSTAAAAVHLYPPALPSALVSSHGRSDRDRSALGDSPRAVQAAETLASLASLGAPRSATESGVGDQPAKDGVEASESPKRPSSKVDRLKKISIDKFLSKKVHKTK